MVRRDIACEGAGVIEVTFVDGSKTSCNIGYVTPGIAEVWGFRVEMKKCVLR